MNKENNQMCKRLLILGAGQYGRVLKEIADATETNRASQTKMVLKMQDDANTLQYNINEITKVFKAKNNTTLHNYPKIL